MTIERLTPLVVAVAVVPRSSAKSSGTFAVGWRPWLTTFAPILIGFAAESSASVQFLQLAQSRRLLRCKPLHAAAAA
jgi:hypothetical protein